MILLRVLSVALILSLPFLSEAQTRRRTTGLAARTGASATATTPPLTASRYIAVTAERQFAGCDDNPSGNAGEGTGNRRAGTASSSRVQGGTSRGRVNR